MAAGRLTNVSNIRRTEARLNENEREGPGTTREGDGPCPPSFKCEADTRHCVIAFRQASETGAVATQSKRIPGAYPCRRGRILSDLQKTTLSGDHIGSTRLEAKIGNNTDTRDVDCIGAHGDRLRRNPQRRRSGIEGSNRRFTANARVQASGQISTSGRNTRIFWHTARHEGG